MKSGNWELDPRKFLSKEEANKLLQVAQNRARLAQSKEMKTAVRDYFLIHLGLATGLRVMEIAALECGHLNLDDNIASLLVVKGKGSKRRRVFFCDSFRVHCLDYLGWKRVIGESVEPDQPLFLSSNTGEHMTTRALQKAFKRIARKAGIPPHQSIHSMRHTYACLLLKASNWNLRLVQKQLGHSKITTTQIYADVMLPEIKRAVEKMSL